jgi:hypothetical protein
MKHIHFILSYRSRYDITNKEFCGPAKDILDDFAHGGQFTYSISYADEPLIPSHSHYVLAGKAAWARYNKADRDVGHVFTHNNATLICSYHPQDAEDVRKIENDGFDAGDEEDDGGTGKDSAVTNRANYRFWIAVHIDKLFSVYRHAPYHVRVEPLWSTGFPESTYLYLDIESHPPSDTLQCISIAFDDGSIFAQTIYDYKGNLTPDALRSMVWLVRALKRYTVVIHNANFDLPFLAMFHSITHGPNIQDTMLIWHRMFPEADKSLAHVIQALTNLPYHKDEAGTFTPHNYQQQAQLLAYNARDVYALREVHKAMLPLNPSALSVCESIADYIFTGLVGFYINNAKLLAHKLRLRRELDQLTRAFRILTGDPNFNPNSGKQVGAWLYEGLLYPVRDTTDSGAPATDATTLYKLLADHPKNVALQFLLEIKETSKRLSSLGYEPFIQPKAR